MKKIRFILQLLIAIGLLHVFTTGAWNEKSKLQDTFTSFQETKGDVFSKSNQQSDSLQEQPLRFLLVGYEQTEKSQQPRKMILAQLNGESSVKLVEILPDTVVGISGSEEKDLFHSFSIGGIDVVKDIIEEQFQVGIDHWASVNIGEIQSIVTNTSNEFTNKLQRLVAIAEVKEKKSDEGITGELLFNIQELVRSKEGLSLATAALKAIETDMRSKDILRIGRSLLNLNSMSIEHRVLSSGVNEHVSTSVFVMQDDLYTYMK
ncbi:LCP family glycopolymer transferase [Bacillus sp. 2205SS5-2]|uniref:LCP family glycopolymer transferase n=1 Tax=Bacillus sp. 2205SS5-2 TaxID=3109031 RepID=UPI00300600A7